MVDACLHLYAFPCGNPTIIIYHLNLYIFFILHFIPVPQPKNYLIFILPFQNLLLYCSSSFSSPYTPLCSFFLFLFSSKIINTWQKIMNYHLFGSMHTVFSLKYPLQCLEQLPVFSSSFLFTKTSSIPQLKHSLSPPDSHLWQVLEQEKHRFKEESKYSVSAQMMTLWPIYLMVMKAAMEIKKRKKMTDRVNFIVVSFFLALTSWKLWVKVSDI